MKVLSRDFTLKEKILLIFLIVILLGMAYYFLVFEPTETSIKTANAEAEYLQVQLDALNVRIRNLQKMQSEMDEIENGTGLSYMPSYNYTKEEIKFLNDVLASASTYTVTFAGTQRNDNQIRKEVAIVFSASNVDIAMDMLEQLNNYEYRSLLGNINVSAGTGSLNDGVINVSLTMTFFETMVGGTADAGLPQ